MYHFQIAAPIRSVGKAPSVCRSLLVTVTAMTVLLLSSGSILADPSISPFSQPPAEREPISTTAPKIAAAMDDPMVNLMRSIVSIKATVSDIARTAQNFGTERDGSGVVIDTHGLIVTAGYTIAEASSVTVTFSNGISAIADIIAYDEATGLGLVRTPDHIPTTPIKLGSSKGLKTDQLAMIIPDTGEVDAKGVKIGKISKFTGGWEYMVDNAIHTYPPSTSFSGAALVSDQAELLGIGALVTIDIDIDPKIRVPGNIFVPVDSLTSVLGQLIVSGRSEASQKPWIGIDTKRSKNGIVVSSVVEGGPADQSGIQSGDVIVAVDQSKVTSLSELYEKLWSGKNPGDEVHLLVVRNRQYANVAVSSIDYYDWLKLPPSSDTVITEMTE